MQKFPQQDIPRVMVYNKADKCDELPAARDGVLFSAKTGEGTDELLHAIETALGRGKHELRLCIPYSDGSVLDALHRQAQVVSVDYAAEGTLVTAVVDDKLCGQLQKYKVEEA